MTSSKHIALFAAVFALGCSSSDDGAGGGTGGTDGGVSGGGGSSGGSAGTAGTGGSAGSTGGTAGSAGSAGGSACSPACASDRNCCTGKCANLANDPRNCGACGTVCKDGEWCNGSGKCETRPCTTSCGDASRCCGGACCAAGEICCDLQGPVSKGPECTKPSDTGTCPQGCAPKCDCASPDSLIATPSGQRPIADLQVGDLVYSMHAGELVTVPIAKVQRVPQRNHRVVQLTFVGGARIEMSASHPLADGRNFGELKAGQIVDGATLAAVRVIPYQHDATYDILPQSDSGTYFASGMLVGTTMTSTPALVTAATAPSSAAPRGTHGSRTAAGGCALR